MEPDPSLPPADQLELLDQLITLKLQNIDATFARIHHKITNELLPIIKDYSQNSQPIREAAQFWKTFFEIAENIQAPSRSDQYSTHENDTYPNGESNVHHDETIQPSYSEREQTPEHSFRPLASSTPATAYQRALDSEESIRSTSEFSFEPSSIESNLRMDDTYSFVNNSLPPVDSKGAGRSLLKESTVSDTTSTVTSDFSNLSIFTRQTPPSLKGKSRHKSPSRPLRENVLRQNLRQAATPHTDNKAPPINPFAPSTSKPWNGIVDLAQHSPKRAPVASTSNINSDSSVSFDLSPEVKRKYFNTPQYKLVRNHTPKEAVDIRMAETLAKLPSDIDTTSESSRSLGGVGRSPLRMFKNRAATADNPLLRLKHLEENLRVEENLRRLEDSFVGDDSDDDSLFEDDSILNNYLPGIRGENVAGVGRNGSSSSDDSGNETVQPVARILPNDNSDDSDSSSDGEPAGARQVHDDDFTTYAYDHGEEEEIEFNPDETLDSSDPSTHSGPTETLFGVRSAATRMSTAEFRERMGRPLAPRFLPPGTDTPDSPTPGGL